MDSLSDPTVVAATTTRPTSLFIEVSDSNEFQHDPNYPKPESKIVDDDEIIQEIEREMHSDDENDERLIDADSPMAVDTSLLSSIPEDDLSDADLEEEKAWAEQENKSDAQNRVWTQSRCEANFQAGKPKHFECLYDDKDCQTRQEYYPTRKTGRTVISSIFGHNKNQWLQIPKSVRVFVCRKHYQTSMQELRLQPANLIRMQLRLAKIQVDKIEHWRPDCRFDIQLTSSMNKRLHEYHQLVVDGQPRDQAASTVDALPQKSKKRGVEEDTPIRFALDFHHRFKGNEKTAHDVRDLFEYIQSQADDGTINIFPACEVLLKPRSEDLDRLHRNKVRRAEAEKRHREYTGIAKRKRAPRKAVHAAPTASAAATTFTAPAVPTTPVVSIAPAISTAPTAPTIQPMAVEVLDSSAHPNSDVPPLRIPPPILSFQPINTATASSSEPIRQYSPSPASSQRSGIKLKLCNFKNNKGKAPIRPTTTESNVEPPHVNKRKHMNTPMLSDSDGQDPEVMSKKQKIELPITGEDQKHDGIAKLSVSEIKTVIEIDPTQ